MLIFIKEKLVVFSIPRTGSTSLHKALRPFADIEFSNPPTKKHMNVRRFDRWALENHRRFLRFTRVAVMREPLARMASWYAYRRRDAVRGSSASTRGMTFDQFIEGALSDTPTPATNIGNQHHFVTREDGSLGIHELFCIEKPEVMLAFFEKRFGPLTFPHRNASPDAPLDLSPALEGRLRSARAAEFSLFQSLMPEGHLRVPGVARRPPIPQPSK